MHKVVVIGSGCAGLTAALYTARAGLEPLVIEGTSPGGQLATTTRVENFPGFPDGIDGPTLILNMRRQAERFGARFEGATVATFEPGEGVHSLVLDDGRRLDARAVVVATGASARRLGLPGEPELIGRGLTTCATCDGPFYRDVPVCVIGGGDSACEEALFLTRFASRVHLVHRRDALRASRILADRVLAHPKIEPVWSSVVTAYLTDARGDVAGVRVRAPAGGAERELEARGVFLAVGHTPNTGPFVAHLPADERGYLMRSAGRMTAIPGVFAAGDVADPTYRQAITAAGDGCAAALDAERYLASLGS